MDQATMQRISALKGANKIRYYRAEYKRRIRSGRITMVELGEMFCQPEDELSSIEVRLLLECIRGVGPQKAGRMMRQVGYNYRTRLESMDMSARKRLALIIRRYERSVVS